MRADNVGTRKMDSLEIQRFQRILKIGRDETMRSLGPDLPVESGKKIISNKTAATMHRRRSPLR
jgi:hypothetical protein